MAESQILVCVCGGIAAYKSADLVRRLREKGAHVQVVMTANALNFVGAATFQAVSGRQVRHSLWDESAEAAMSHIELARWADAVVIAPATANTLAKITYGMADDLVTTLCLATRAPVFAAPAMNHVMYNAAATQANLNTLRNRGVQMIGPNSGPQACGEFGPGRMAEPHEIVEALELAHIFEGKTRRHISKDDQGVP